MPIYPLRVHVLWSPRSEESARLAELIARRFDGLGMDADGTAVRVPVRFRSEPWDGQGTPPRPIDLGQASHNLVVLLHDFDTDRDQAIWSPYVAGVRADMAKRGRRDAYLPFGDPSGQAGTLQGDTGVQYARRDLWPKSQAAQDTRLLLHLMFRARELLRVVDKDERLFVSHAKRDGDLVARQIVDAVNHSSNDVPIETFYDASELIAGERFDQRFEAEISNGTLLAIGSDAYDSRPWCNREMLIAKRAARPILIADTTNGVIPRTFPYGANVPRHRLGERDDAGLWIELLLVEVMSEGLRCDVFRLAAGARAPGAFVLPRPPELLDAIELPSGATLAVYPDPPLARAEEELITRALAGRVPVPRLVPLGEAS